MFLLQFSFPIDNMELSDEWNESELQFHQITVGGRRIRKHDYSPCKQGETIKSKFYNYKVGADDAETLSNKYKAQEQHATQLALISVHFMKIEVRTKFLSQMGIAVDEDDDEPPAKKRMTEMKI